MTTYKNILVTGAGGFIGGWLVDTFFLEGKQPVRAGIRSWTTAARLGRLPVDIVPCNVTDPKQVAAAMEGVDAVVHCAVGTAQATVEGTRNMLEAAHRAGVRRFVHISTVDVYGDSAGVVEESTPFKHTGEEYGETKIQAEEACWEYHAKGLPVTILRPTIVYGPYNKLWIAKFAERIMSGRWGTFGELGDGTCNLVYVGDVAQAVRLALTKDEAVGEAFNVNGNQAITWNEYFSRLNAALGNPPLRAIAASSFRRASTIMTPIKRVARFGLKHFGGAIMTMYEKSPIVRRFMKQTEQRMKTTPGGDEIAMFARKVSYPIGKAEKLLGYRPGMSIDQGLAVSVQWLAHETQMFRK
jgi:nucleoside-diphosphate-sugar epimerase